MQLIITKIGYIDTLDYNKKRNKEETERFEYVKKIFYKGTKATEEEILDTIYITKRFDNIDLIRI